MNFFESKYFVDLQVNNYNNGWSNFHDSERNMRRAIANYTGSDFNGDKILSRHLVRIVMPDDYEVVKEAILKDWTLVTDLNHSIIRGKLSERFISNAYFHKEQEMFVVISEYTLEENEETKTRYTFYVPPTTNVVAHQDWLFNSPYTTIKPERTEPRIGILGVNHTGGFKITWNTLDEINIDFNTMYSPDFTPVNDTVLKLVNGSGKPGLFILHGLPGTGKTTYIKWLTSQTKRPFLYIPPHMVSSLSQPKFVEFLMGRKGYTFIVEDAESALTSAKGERNSAVSTLLNITDGILGDVLDCQFICTFNTQIDNIDPALLRPGRLLVEYEFKELEPSVANKYLAEQGRSDVSATKPMVLADVINLGKEPIKSYKSIKPKFGFI